MKKIISQILIFGIFLPILVSADTNLSNVKSFNITAGRDTAELNWENPNEYNFYEVVLFRSSIPIEDYFSYEAVEGICKKIYNGKAETFLDSELAENLPYYYIIFTKTKFGESSKAKIVLKEVYKESAEKISDQEILEEINNGSPTTSLNGENSSVVNQVSFNEAGIIYNYNKFASTEASSESSRLALFIIVKSPHDLNDNDKDAISYFIHTGSPTTIFLGNGERAGVLNSYLSAFNKLPRNTLEWQDVIKIANGRWPNERNETKETEAQNEYFSKVYERKADMDNPKDSAAVTIIAYGLRPGNRNLENEKKAIEIYRNIFNKEPTEALDWDLIRAIAYSGAVR